MHFLLTPSQTCTKKMGGRRSDKIIHGTTSLLHLLLPLHLPHQQRHALDLLRCQPLLLPHPLPLLLLLLMLLPLVRALLRLPEAAAPLLALPSVGEILGAGSRSLEW